MNLINQLLIKSNLLMQEISLRDSILTELNFYKTKKALNKYLFRL